MLADVRHMTGLTSAWRLPLRIRSRVEAVKKSFALHVRWILSLCVCSLGCAGTAPADPASSAPAPAVSQESSHFEPPPYDYGALSEAERDDVCSHTGEPPSTDGCSADADCRICHDGSNCGIPANLETLRRRGAECTREDAAECEYAAVRCCRGHCRVVSH